MGQTLNILLGAGFSYHADVPMVDEISKRFQRNNKENLLRQSSQEWQWIDDKNDALIHNGKLGFDDIGGSILLNQIVDDYLSTKGDFENYELFLQYVIDKVDSSNDWTIQIFKSALENLEEEYSDIQDNYKKILRYPSGDLIKNLIHELIADSLVPRKNDDEITSIYGKFIDYCKNYEKVNIFTLNHDTLLEKYLDYFSVNYTDGFSKEESTIIYNNEPQETFQNLFNEKGVRLFKLHGSKNIIDFKVMEKSGLIYNPTGDFIYFKPNSYQAKHFSQRIDSKTKEVVQNFQPNITPFFLTGDNKSEIIQNNEMFNALFECFDNELSNSDDLLIIGYSYKDSHINSLIETKVNEHKPSVININPSDKYLNTSYENLRELDDMSEL